MSFLSHLQDEKKGIRENLDEGYFEFYVAGYTKQCQGVYVQANHSLLLMEATRLAPCPALWMDKPPDEPNNYLWPFGYKSLEIIQIQLLPEKDNRYDPHAIVVKAFSPCAALPPVLTLGYVPKKISRAISTNLDKIKPGWVKKVRLIHNGKHCSTKVAIPWVIGIEHLEKPLLDRVASVIKDLDEDDM